jgi:hypothetical protein
MSKYVMVYTREPVIELRCHIFEMPDDFDESLLPESGAADVPFVDGILPVLQEVDRFGPTLVGSETQDTETDGPETVRSWDVQDGDL